MPANDKERQAYENCAKEIRKDEGPIHFHALDGWIKQQCDLKRLELGDKEFFRRYGEASPPK